jgi:hypothetical protein
MVRVKAEHFGFDKINNQFAKYENNVKEAKVVLEKHANKMKDTAISNARAGGLVETGKGIKGIVTEPTENGYNVGWASRPNFHLYFHELGFHAVDNRHGKQTIRRDTKGARKRRYGRVRATYVPPTPHMRPAFKANERQFLYEMVTTIQDSN